MHKFSKRLTACLLAAVLLFSCAQAETRFSILAVNFPAFDLSRSLAGDLAEVAMLLPPGSESHSYEPSPQDIIAIQNADLFIYTGGESDHWVEEILHSMGDAAPAVFRLSDSVTLLEEQHSASMEHAHDHAHCNDPGHVHAEMDEHVWTSPKNMMLITRSLCETLQTLMPQHADALEAACAEYLLQLEQLDASFSQIVQEGKRDLIIFGDRFPFRYFAAAYGLRYDAAFPGCSEDSEPSVRTVISLVDTVREQEIPVIFYIEFSSRRTADILAEETGAVPLLFHSCHNVSSAEIEAGATYLSLMQKNAEALKEALN